ncbi:low temperature requirement protein A [Streptomyces sp. NPDC102402]|uniref:low temperature requirement protein A n=1 Tax=Streptomyces sp. NPDC102402 TaxID=3366169 RepID=UPI0037FFCE77
MTLRDPSEEGRTATYLELFFDLVFVVTISAIASQWHHAIAGGDVASGLVSLAVVMFAVWWAWMGFTWFANFFDTDDVAYRILVFVQLLASLGLASGIPFVFQDGDFRVMTVCYVVLRVAMSLQWLRAGRANPQLRQYSLRWASGIWACQIFWVVFAFGHWPGAVAAVMVLVGCAGELAVPVWANRLPPGRRAVTHPEHIEERYGLFTLIILGEMVLGASEAFNAALEDHAHSWPLVMAAVLCAVLAFLLWWLYFGFLGHYDLSDNRTAFIWGFGHYLVFASLAAADGALGALIDAIATTESALPGWGIGLTLAAPVSVFLLIASLMRAAAGARLRGWWLRAAVVVLAAGAGAGSWGPVWALAAVCVVLAVLLAAQIIDKASGPRAG